MSTFLGKIEEIRGLSVDRFDEDNLVDSTCFFLSHCHQDHMKGLLSETQRTAFIKRLKKCNGYLYCSPVTATIIKSRYPDLSKYVVDLSLQALHHVQIPDVNDKDNSEHIEVTLVSAAHCPGSVMFLFVTSEGNRILYTGDFRLDRNEIQALKALHDSEGRPLKIDKLYFDSTFWNEQYSQFPKRSCSTDAVCDSINKWCFGNSHPIVQLVVPSFYGYEGLLVDVAEQMKMKIYIPEEPFSLYRCLPEMDGLFTNKKTHSHIHCRLKYKRDYNDSDKEIKQIILSAMYWTEESLAKNENETSQSDDNYLRVCYSSHCSFEELKDFISYFKPKNVEPCVVYDEHVRESVEDFVRKLSINNSIKSSPNNERKNERICKDFKLRSSFSSGHTLKRKKSDLYYLMNKK